MPFTPFHFGAGAALHAAAPRHVSFLAFCAGNVLMDVESLYHILTEQYPVHRFLHSFVGATLAWPATLLLFLGAQWLARRLPLPDLFGWRSLRPLPIAVGAALGCYSHVCLDALTHRDMEPLAPFSSENPFLGLASIGTVKAALVAVGAAGLVGLAIRWRLRRLP